MSSSGIIAVVFIAVCQIIGTQAYEWSCSSLDTNTNKYLLPDIHGLITQGSGQRRDQEVAGRTGDFTGSRADLYFYQIPPSLNCTGTVTAIEYCFFTLNLALGTTVNVIRFYRMEVTGSTARINSTMDFSTLLSSDKCTSVTTGDDVRNYCCETHPLSANFLLPSASNFSFGIRAFNPPGVGMLAFRSSLQIIVDYFAFDESTTLSLGAGDTLQLPATSSMEFGLRLFNLVVSATPEVTAEPPITTMTLPPTTAPPTTAPPTTIPSTTPTDLTSDSTSLSPGDSTTAHMTEGSGFHTTNTAISTDHDGDHSTPTGDNQSATAGCANPGDSDCPTTAETTEAPSDIIPLMAGIIGGLCAALVFILLFLCLFFIIYKCPRRKKATFTVTATNGDADRGFQGNFENGFSTIRSENPYDYIDTLPSSHHHIHDTKTGSNVAYNVHTDAVIISELNGAPPNMKFQSNGHVTSRIMSQYNEAYGVHANPSIRSQSNEAYGVHANPSIRSQSNEAYGVHANPRIMSQSNEAYGIHTNPVIMSQSNEAYGVTSSASKENIIYETIGPATDHVDKNGKVEFETEANCAYGKHSDEDVVVVSPNHAYGRVPSKSNDIYYT